MLQVLDGNGGVERGIGFHASCGCGDPDVYRKSRRHHVRRQTQGGNSTRRLRSRLREARC